MEVNFSTDAGVGVGDGSSGNANDGGEGSGGNVNDGERWAVADEASLGCPQLTSCCAARFLTGLGPGVGNPWSTIYMKVERNVKEPPHSHQQFQQLANHGQTCFILLPYDPAIPLLVIYPREMKTYAP